MQHEENILIDAPPPYQLQSEGIYLPDMDMNAWPSTYYGRSRRIDLAKFYHDILKASTNDDQCNSDSSSGNSSDEDEQVNQIRLSRVTATQEKSKKSTTKKVTFTEAAPTIYEYEAEYDSPTKAMKTGSSSLFDDGWPGRTKNAMESSGFMDFKSKIEAKLGAINDPSLISELDKSNENVDESSLLYNQEESPLFRGYYRHRKSPLVKKLNLRPVPNTEQQHQPSLMEDTPSPSNSYTESPVTPKDSYSIPLLGDVPQQPSSSSTSSNSSVLSPGGSKWLNRTLSRIRSTSSRTK
ncbi:unnamed protein product [Mucor hiemalis]